MYIYKELLARADRGEPVRAGLIGAGKFGSMFLSQVPSTPGLRVTCIADLDPDRARKACGAVGWDHALISRTRFVDDALDAIGASDVDVVIEATGNPVVGVPHARAAFKAGRHVVMAASTWWRRARAPSTCPSTTPRRRTRSGTTTD